MLLIFAVSDSVEFDTLCGFLARASSWLRGREFSNLDEHVGKVYEDPMSVLTSGVMG